MSHDIAAQYKKAFLPSSIILQFNRILVEFLLALVSLLEVLLR